MSRSKVKLNYYLIINKLLSKLEKATEKSSVKFRSTCTIDRLIKKCICISRDTVVSIVTGYRLEDRVSILGRSKEFLCSTGSDCPSNSVSTPEALYFGFNWPGFEVNHLHPSSVEVKMSGIIPPLTCQQECSRKSGRIGI
jgi:hypothetical protein